MLGSKIESALHNLRQQAEQSYRPPAPQDVAEFRQKVRAALQSAGIAITPEIGRALDDGYIHTPGGLDRLVQAYERSSSSREGAASTSFLGAITGGVQGPRLTHVTPAEAVQKKQPARDPQTAHAQVQLLIAQRLAEISGSSNRAVLEELSSKLQHDARSLWCDLSNGKFGSVHEQHYSEAFTRSLSPLGIDFDWGYFARAKLTATPEGLDIQLRRAPETAELVKKETGQDLATISSDALLEWFLSRKPDAELLQRLATRPPPSGPADLVTESIARALSTTAVTRGPLGSDRASLVGHFGWNRVPEYNEANSIQHRILKVAYQRLGMELKLDHDRVPSYSDARPGSVPHARLAHEIRRHPELSQAFKAATQKEARDADATTLVDWFKSAKPRADQVLDLATRDLASTEQDLAREEMRRLLLSQSIPMTGSKTTPQVGTALIVVANTATGYIEANRDRHKSSSPALAEASREVLKSLGLNEMTGKPIDAKDPSLADLAGRIRSNATLAPRLGLVKSSAGWADEQVIRWFREQPADATALIELGRLG